MQRIAVIFDHTRRPETTGIYCRLALRELARAGRIAEVEHFLPGELDRVLANRFDLFLYVDDGLIEHLRPDLRPAVWWAIDTHLGFDRCLNLAEQADLTFAAQRNGAEQLQAAGIAAVMWLPLACDPQLHGRRHVPSEHEVAFVGNLASGPRLSLLQLLQRTLGGVFIGRAYFDEMAAIYSASKIVFNRSVRDDVNMRVFEGLCSGSLLVTNDLSENGQTELFQDGVHCATYRDEAELLDKVRFYLAHNDVRERIAAAGRNEAVNRHTYRHRIETILEHMEGSATAVHVSVPGCPAKDRSYFEFDRPDVLDLVPHSARRVLDIGCGAGWLGAAIKRRQPAQVTGIERDPTAAVAARGILDEVIERDIRDSIEFERGTFDCVICADVLEHIPSPRAVLEKVRNWLAPGGCLVTSIPNVRHHSVVRSLLSGNWTYETAGLLDQDHIQFFTRREIEKLLFRSGFEIDEARVVSSDGYREWVDSGRPTEIQLPGLAVRVPSPADAEEFYAYQYLMRSKPVARSENRLTSIVLVTHNQLAFTRTCLDSIRLRTDEPYELIVVDNGSTDGTPQFLRRAGDIQPICNAENRGFPAAANQGIRAARGDHILLLNNDTVVTTGWLRRMLGALDADPRIGLVGPVSNNVSGPQHVPADYSQLAELDGFAWDRAKRHLGCRQEVRRLVGFCLLAKREVFDRVGLLDERFGIGNFEDDDFCRRAREAGYRAVIARDAFVHHFGSVTFQASGVDFAGVLKENRRKYLEKWNGEAKHGANGRNGTPVETARAPADAAEADHRPPDVLTAPGSRPQYLFDVDDEGALLLKPNDVHLSACLIVRDNENTIRPCLESLKPWVDEIVVVDTGSQDATPRICEELGVRVFHWAWKNSFSAARNVSFDLARGEWIFWMDSDDTLPEECGRKLRDLALGTHSENVQGYVMQVHCPGNDPHDVTIVDHVKLIRNRPDLRFEFRIHEQILPAIRRADGDVAFTDIYVVHSGSDRTPDGRQRKLKRDFHLLDLDLKERPDHPFVLFNLGMTCSEAGWLDKAAEYLQRCLAVSVPTESHLRKAYAILAGVQMQQKDDSAARQTCEMGLTQFSNDRELLFRRAMLRHRDGDLAAAADDYRRILNQPVKRHFCSMDAGIAGYKARHNLAVVYEEMGCPDEAQEEWEGILGERPDYQAAKAALRRLARPQRICTIGASSEAVYGKT